jgi:hypothetical protein
MGTKRIMPIANALALLIVSLPLYFLGACTDKSPIPKSHPASDFYQIAATGPTTADECRKHDGLF